MAAFFIGFLLPSVFGQNCANNLLSNPGAESPLPTSYSSQPYPTGQWYAANNNGQIVSATTFKKNSGSYGFYTFQGSFTSPAPPYTLSQDTDLSSLLSSGTTYLDFSFFYNITTSGTNSPNNGGIFIELLDNAKNVVRTKPIYFNVNVADNTWQLGGDTIQISASTPFARLKIQTSPTGTGANIFFDDFCLTATHTADCNTLILFPKTSNVTTTTAQLDWGQISSNIFDIFITQFFIC